MAPLLGVLCGLGVFLIWWSAWEQDPLTVLEPKPKRLESLLLTAGIDKVSAGGFIASCVGLGLFATLVVYIATASFSIAGCFGLFGAWLPLAVVKWQARKRTAMLRELWPDVVDHLRSAIRAGLSLPEALIQLGDRGPEELRALFREFAADYRSGGHFDSALSKLKERLADPVADRIIEALRLTRDVGGSDLGRLLRTLAEFLRESARTRRELEARQSWTINGARLAVAAPWIVLMFLASRPEAVAAYNSAAGVSVLGGGLLVSGFCYWAMLRVAALPEDERVLR